MNSLKWRLSFSSTNSSSNSSSNFTGNYGRSWSGKHFKNLWLECKIFIEIKDDSDILSLVASIDIDRKDSSANRPIVAFIDYLTFHIHHHQDHAILSSILEEISEDLLAVFTALLKLLKAMIVKNTILSTENVMKILSVLEIVASFKSNKIYFGDRLALQNPCTRPTLELLNLATSLPQKLSILRILKSVIVSDKDIAEFMHEEFIDKIFIFLNAESSKEQSIIYLVLNILQRLIDFALNSSSSAPEYRASDGDGSPCTTYLHSSSISARTANRGNCSNSGNSASNMHREADSPKPPISLASRGFNLAANVVGELIKLAPLSAASWLAPAGDAESEKKGDDYHTLSDDAAFSASFVLSSTVCSEEQTRLELLRDELCFDPSKVSHHYGLAAEETTTTATSADSLPAIQNPADIPEEVAQSQLGPVIERFLKCQELYTAIFVGIEEAKTPTDAIYVLQILESLLVRSAIAKAAVKSDGYSLLSQMFLRIEENIIYLAPCRSSFILPTESVKVSIQGQPTPATGNDNIHAWSIEQTALFSAGAFVPSSSTGVRIASALSANSLTAASVSGGSNHSVVSDISGVSLYLSDAGVSFDGYYTSILSSLLHTITTEYYASATTTGVPTPRRSTKQSAPLPPLSPRWMLIQNCNALLVIVDLLKSGKVSLVLLALRICYSLIKSNSRNIVALESAGVIAVLIQLTVTLMTTANIQISNSQPNDIAFHDMEAPSEGLFIGDSCKVSLSVLTDVMSLLQLMSVALSNIDVSIMSGLTTIILHSILSFESEPISSSAGYVGGNTPASRSLDGSGLICENCESEDAQLECLSDGCVRDKFKRLCDECDKVFHKSAVKKAHIRLPILPIHRKYCQPCSNSDMSTWEDEDISSMLDLLSGGALQALTCQNIIHCGADKRRKLSARRYDTRNIAKYKDFYFFRESAISIICATVRNLLDDRIVQNQSLPFVLFCPLLLCLRGSVIEKFDDSDFYPKTDFKVSNSSFDLSVLVENTEPQYFPAWSACDSTRNSRAFDRHSHQPPAVANQCPRRIRLVIMLQTLCKFTVTGISHSRLRKTSTVSDQPTSISRSSLTACLEGMIGYGIHAVLIHLLIDTSRYSNLTFSDKQFVMWVLREHIVLSMHLSSPAGDDFLSWTCWLLKCDVVYNNVKLTSAGRDSKKEFSRNQTPLGGLPLPPSAVTLLPPISNPIINLSIRFCVLQELRFLFAGMDSNRSFEYNGECRPYRVPFLNDSNKAPSPTTEEDWLLVGNIPLISTVAKEMLARNGFVELLVDIISGKLCSRYVSNVMSALSDCSSSLEDSFSNYRITELEKEEWFCALATLAQLVCGFDRAKAAIDSHVGLQSLFHFFATIVNCLSNIPESVVIKRQKILNYPIDYKPAITNLLIELCLRGGRFVAPHTPYNQVDFKFPIPLSVKNVLEEQSSLAPSKVNFTAADIAMQIFFNRDFLVGGSRGADSELSDKESPGKRSQSFASLSPTYFLMERTASLVEKSLQPHPAPLAFASLSRGFQSSAKSSFNVTPTNMQSYQRKSGSNLSQSTSMPFSPAMDDNLIRKVLTKNISTASIHSMESEFQWDTDSNNGQSSEQLISRGPSGSFTGSHHSLLALSQALRAKVNDTISNRDDLTPEQSCCEPDDLNKSMLSMDLKYKALVAVYNKANTSIAISSDKLLVEDNLSSYFVPKKSNEPLYPFPPMHGSVIEGLHDISSVPSVHFPVLRGFPEFRGDLAGFDFPTMKSSLLVFLHHLLIIRATPFKIPPIAPGTKCSVGLKIDDFEDDDEQEVDEENSSHDDNNDDMLSEIVPSDSLAPKDEDEIFQWRYVFHKHLSYLLPPEKIKSAASSKKVVGEDQIWRPPFSSLQLRSHECGELLFSLAAVSCQETQAFILSTLSYLIDGNPANAFVLIHQPATCLALTKLIPYFGDGLREAAAYLLSQLMRYSTQVSPLEEVLHLATTAFRDVESGEKEESILCKSILFSMGRIAESIGSPTAYLHFDQKSPLEAAVSMPKVSVSQLSTCSTITFCSWVRLGTLGHAPTSSLAQFSTKFGVVDIYFRVLFKVVGPGACKNSDNESVASGYSNLPGEFVEVNEPLHRSIQLCVSFHSPSSFNGEGKSEQVPLEAEPKSPFEASHQDERTSNNSDLHLPSCDKHWKLAVDQLFNCSESEEADKVCFAPTEDDTSDSIRSPLSQIASMISRYSMPDVIIDFEWSELGDWHLLAISFDSEHGIEPSQTTSGVKCWIDGVSKNVLEWTPLGYRGFHKAEGQRDPILSIFKDGKSIFGDGNDMEHKELFHKAHCNQKSALTILQGPRSDIVGSNDEHLLLSLGGIVNEKNCYNKLVDCLQSSIAESARPDHPWSSQSLDWKISTYWYIIRCFETVVSGFSGSVADVAIFDGRLDPNQLRVCFKEGPTAKFFNIKNAKLSGLNIQSGSSDQAINVSDDITSTSKTLTFRPISPPPSSFFAPSPIISYPETKLSVELEMLRLFDSVSAGNAGATKMKTPCEYERGKDSIQFHQTKSLISALSSLGGMKAMYPMFILDKGRLIAAMRIIGCIITSKKSYALFLSSFVDKVLLYCFRSNPSLVTPEAIQVLFELSIKFEYRNVGSFAENPLVPSTTEIIDKIELIELIFDVVVLFPVARLENARIALDRLREVTDEVHENSQKVLKISGTFPILIILSLWNIENVDDMFLQSTGINPSAAILEKKNKKPPSVEHNPSSSSPPVIAFTPLVTGDSLARRVTIPNIHDYQSMATKMKSTIEINPPNDSFLNAKFALSRKADLVGSRSRSVDLSEREEGIPLQHFMDYYKLQLSCFRVLEQLFKGTSSETVIQMNKIYNTVSQSATGFNSSHMTTFIGFIICAIRGKRSRESSGRDSIALSRSAVRRRKRSKRPLREMFGSVAILENMDMNTENYWVRSAAVVVLDIILNCIDTPMEICITTMLRSALSGSSLWMVVLELSGSECVEVRERSLRLLMLSLSTADGKLDAKQVTGFERINGFKLLADQISAHVDAATESIVDGIFNIMFWSRRSFSIKDKSNKVVDEFNNSTVSASDGRLPKRVNSEDGGNSVQDCEKVPRDDTKAVKEEEPIDLPTSGGGILSKLLKGQASSASKHSPSSEEGWNNPTGVEENNSMAGSPTETSRDLNALGIASSAASAHVLALPPVTPPRNAPAQSNLKRLRPLSPLKLSEKKDAATESSGAVASEFSEPQDSTHEEVSTIHVPQMLEVLVRVLQSSSSAELVADSFQKLERSITHRHVNKDRGDSSRKGAADAANKGIEAVRVNADLIFSQKDWIQWLCDTLLLYRSRSLNCDDDPDGMAHSGVMSCSENESANDSYSNAMDSNDDLVPDSDDSLSHGSSSRLANANALSDAVSNGDCSSNGTHHKASTWHTTPFTASIFRFINKLLLVDMRLKYSSTRKWLDVFRLSLPETYDVQEVIIADLVDTLDTFTTHEKNIEVSMNFLRNVGMLLEQALEKVDLSLMLCLKVVLSLHTLSYSCPPEIRTRIKETCIPELRKGYIVRCLIDFSQEFYTRALAVIEVSSPLEGYLLSSDSKPLQNSHVILIVLSILLEAFEELEFLLTTVDSEAFLSSYEENASQQYVSSSSYERLDFVIELIQSLLTLVQGCVKVSSECRKVVTKLLSWTAAGYFQQPALPAGAALDDRDSLQEDLDIMKAAFLNTFAEEAVSQTPMLVDSKTSAVQTASTSSSHQHSSVAATAATSSSTLSWWGAWTSYQTPPESSPAAVPAPAIVVGESSLSVDSLAEDAVSVVVQQAFSTGEDGRDASPLGTNKKPDSIPSFIRWYSASEQRSLQAEMKLRMSVELRPVFRQCDKLREKSATRFARFSRLLQDKVAKESVSNRKVLKEAQNACKVSVDKVAGLFQRDLRLWTSALKDKLEVGRVAFRSSSASASADSSCVSPSEKEAAALRVPSALISLLAEQHGEAGQGDPDRGDANQLLRMLAEFFQTARGRVP